LDGSAAGAAPLVDVLLPVVALPLAETPPLALGAVLPDALLPPDALLCASVEGFASLEGFCSWLVEGAWAAGVCAPLWACLSSAATALSENIAAATATAIGLTFMRFSFSGCVDGLPEKRSNSRAV